ERQVVDVVAGDAVAGGHAGRDVPKVLALGEADGAGVALADDDRLAGEDAGEVQVVRLALLAPDGAAVLEVDAVDLAGVGGGEDHLAVHDDRRADLPLGVGGLSGVVGPALRPGHPTLGDAPGARVVLFLDVVLVAVGVRPDEAAGQQVDAEDGAGVGRADEDAFAVGQVRRLDAAPHVGGHLVAGRRQRLDVEQLAGQR